MWSRGSQREAALELWLEPLGRRRLLHARLVEWQVWGWDLPSTAMWKRNQGRGSPGVQKWVLPYCYANAPSAFYHTNRKTPPCAFFLSFFLLRCFKDGFVIDTWTCPGSLNSPKPLNPWEQTEELTTSSLAPNQGPLWLFFRAPFFLTCILEALVLSPLLAVLDLSDHSLSNAGSASSSPSKALSAPCSGKKTGGSLQVNVLFRAENGTETQTRDSWHSGQGSSSFLYEAAGQSDLAWDPFLHWGSTEGSTLVHRGSSGAFRPLQPTGPPWEIWQTSTRDPRRTAIWWAHVKTHLLEAARGWFHPGAGRGGKGAVE